MSQIKFTAEHAWVRLDGDLVTVGISDFAQEQLGDLVFVELPKQGLEVDAGQEVVVIESVKAAGDIKSPVSGTIVEVNTDLLDTPEKVNDDPTGEGWFFRVRPQSSDQLNDLLSEEDYQALIAQ